jgi:hypothetical protein
MNKKSKMIKNRITNNEDCQCDTKNVQEGILLKASVGSKIEND